MRELAIKKLEQEYRQGKYDRYADIMKESVLDTLIEFCRQNEEFAQAVYQGGSFEDCMKSVAQDCGNGISDLKAYVRAARFYFEGAGIHAAMTLDLSGQKDQTEYLAEKSQERHPEAPAEPKTESRDNKDIVLDLTRFL